VCVSVCLALNVCVCVYLALPCVCLSVCLSCALMCDCVCLSCTPKVCVRVLLLPVCVSYTHSNVCAGVRVLSVSMCLFLFPCNSLFASYLPHSISPARILGVHRCIPLATSALRAWRVVWLVLARSLSLSVFSLSFSFFLCLSRSPSCPLTLFLSLTLLLPLSLPFSASVSLSLPFALSLRS
jgi:hypothetical protein